MWSAAGWLGWEEIYPRPNKGEFFLLCAWAPSAPLLPVICTGFPSSGALARGRAIEITSVPASWQVLFSFHVSSQHLGERTWLFLPTRPRREESLQAPR
jgi:hypothetical protein